MNPRNLQAAPRTKPRAHAVATLFGVLLASSLAAACGDAVVGPASASREAPTSAAVDGQVAHQLDIRPASVDEPLDPKQQHDIAG